MNDAIVLGGTGFIGRSLCDRLDTIVAPAAKVIQAGSREVDLVNRQATFDWFERHHWLSEVDHIFHLAALYKAGGWPAEHPATQFHANMAINLNALEAWKRFCPRARFTSVVSYCMYPDHERPHPENELYGTEPEPYLFAYAFTKKALLVGQQAYCQEFGLSAASAVLPTVYGPGDSFAEDSHVMGALIGKFSRAVAEGRAEVEIWGDGNQEREFLYVDDAVDGILAVAERADSPVLNLGQGRAYSIRELAETIRDATGFQGRIHYNTDRFVGAPKRLLDVARVRTELQWSPQTSLAEGIRNTVANYQRRLAA